MLYNYIKLADETQIAYSNIQDDNTVEIAIERPVAGGFDAARCLLPAYRWTSVEGFTQKEIDDLADLLQHNAPLIFFFWIGENGEPVHIHVAIKRPTEHATKIWLTASGGCILANNGSNIPKRDLSNIMELVALNHGYICQKWQETFQGDISFYC